LLRDDFLDALFDVIHASPPVMRAKKLRELYQSYDEFRPESRVGPIGQIMYMPPLTCSVVPVM
jgi:hypothetical protein